MSDKVFLGFQLTDANGKNIQGDDDDPTNTASFVIMTPRRAIKEISRLPGYLLMPIFEGDVEEPVIIDYED